MVGVVEAADTADVGVVDGGCAVLVENLHRGIDLVTVVRIVLEQVHLVHESAAEGLPEIDVGLVRVERAVGVGRIHEPFAAGLAGDNVYHASQRVCAEPHRDNPLIDLYALGEVHWYVVQTERAAYTFLRYSVDEDLDVLPAEPVKHQGHV